MNRPKIDAPDTTRPPPNRTFPARPAASRTRSMIASATGDPTTSARKTVRRDQSIWPTDRSKMRAAAAIKVGGVGNEGAGGLIAVAGSAVV